MRLKEATTYGPWLWGVLWAVLVLASLYDRPLLPVDETRYVSVAWEMWLRGDFLVPHLNGAPYSHKPPLLFWMINAGWAVVGVTDWWARLVAPLFGFGSLLLAAALARRLWPASQAWLIAPLFLLGSFYWDLFTTVTMFDLIMCFWTLTGLIGLVDVWQGKPLRGWCLYALAIGLGVLSKGPAILVYLLPSAIFAPLWAVSRPGSFWRHWYLILPVAILGGAAIALTWAIPAGFAGGDAYRNAIFWGQSAGRMVDSFAHQQPVWWYLPVIPALLLPWVIWPTFLVRTWRAIQSRTNTGPNPGLRLTAIWGFGTVIIFSMISGKQPHYMLPMFPAIALAAAYGLSRAPALSSRWDLLPPALITAALGAVLLFAPEIGLVTGHPEVTLLISRWWSVILFAAALWLVFRPLRELSARLVTLTSTSVLVVIVLQFAARPVVQELYGVQSVADYVAGAQAQGYAVANYGKYHGQYNFLGRLRQPVSEIGDETVSDWLETHPKSIIVSYQKTLPAETAPIFTTRFRSGTLVIWDGEDVKRNPHLPRRDAN